MIKIKTLFKKDPENLALVINEVDPDNQWVIDGEGTPTKKFDGTACMIEKGQIYKRYDLKRDKKTGLFKSVPVGAIACQEPDLISGHWPHWILCSQDKPEDKRHCEAFYLGDCHYEDGTYELCGPGINGNNEKFDSLRLIKHGGVLLFKTFDLTFEGIKEYLKDSNIEGIVYHHIDGRMCKIRRSDFGFKWPIL